MAASRNTQIRILFNSISVLLLLIFYYNVGLIRNRNPRSGSKYKTHHRRFLQKISNTSSLNATNDIHMNAQKSDKKSLDPQICDDLFTLEGYSSPCDYLKAHPECNSGGFLNYMKFLYCECQNHRFLGYLVLSAWLVTLFYLLGNTASEYFCYSVEKLSNLLKMSPTIAGVTLLPLGNGAPDVFASIAAFVGNGSGDMGLNGVLGGAVFVTCVVVGVVSLCVSDKRVQIDKKCFIRDICFFLFTMMSLTLILVDGKVNIWEAMAFVSIYVVYALFIALDEICQNKGRTSELNGWTQLHRGKGNFSSRDGEEEDESKHNNPLELSTEISHLNCNSNGDAIYFDDIKLYMNDNQSSPLQDCKEETEINEEEYSSSSSCSKLCSILETPLIVLRRLTIPVIEEDRWSKFYAVSSATLAPILLAILWSTQEHINPLSKKITYFVSFTIGSILGLLAFLYTNSDHPPHRFKFPWVFGGFFMSIVWFYIIANELVSLLISFGTILVINPSILAVTILAWGNSIGDLTANTALAMNQRDGVQIAMSGSYAGPMFNTLIGLGTSMLLGAWSVGSEPYIIPRDISLFFTMGFLAAGLIWALVVLPLSDMRPNKILGLGLITIYLIFLGFKIARAMGLSSLVGVIST